MKKRISFRTAVALMLLASALTCVLLAGGAWLYYGREILGEIGAYAALRRDIDAYYIGEYQNEAVSEAALDAAVAALDDKWSYYMTPVEYQRYLNSSNNQYSGLGISVRKDEATGGLLITGVYAGSPAEKSGLVVNDVVTAIDGRDVTVLPLHDATALVERPLGQTVRLTVLGADGKIREIDVEYALVSTTPVTGALLNGNVGYIAIKNFEAGAGDDFIEAADDLIAQGAKFFVFDVRNNGGGKVIELTTILDHLLPECEIFVAVDKSGSEQVIKSGPENVRLPSVVLVNGYTFSAAEYFAAVLQEYGYASVVGERSTGKNRSQITLKLPNGGALHISSGEYLTPRRVSLAKQGGVAPDREVLLPEEDNILLYNGLLDDSRDTQLAEALKILSDS